MASLMSMPSEIILQIASHVSECSTLSALALTNRSCYQLANEILYRLAARRLVGKYVLFWAISSRRISTVKMLLEAGQNPNTPWISRQRGSSERYCSLNRWKADQWGDQEAESTDDWELKPNLLVRSVVDWFDYDWPESRQEDDDDTDTDTDNDDDDDDASISKLCWTALHMAAAQGNNELVQILLDHGANLNASSQWFCQCHIQYHLESTDNFAYDVGPWWTPLHTAICNNHESTAKLLLSSAQPGLFMNKAEGTLDIAGRRTTILHYACQLGMVSFAKFLLDEAPQGADIDINAEDPWTATPLETAYSYGSWECIDLLLKHGARINTTPGSHGYQNMLWDACRNQRFSDACRMIDLGIETGRNGIDPENPESLLTLCLLNAWNPNDVGFGDQSIDVVREKGKQLLNTLIARGARVNIKTDRMYDASLLILAATSAISDAVDILIANGADVNATTYFSKTALHCACENVHRQPIVGIVRRLLENGAAADPIDSNKVTPLRIVCFNTKYTPEQKQEIIDILLKAGANPLGYSEKCTPLEAAFERLDTTTVRTFLPLCRDSITKEHVLSILEVVSKNINNDLLQILFDLDQGRWIGAEQDSIEAMLKILRNPGIPSAIMAYLVEKLSSFNILDSNKAEILSAAITHDRGIETIERLLLWGADPNLVSQTIMRNALSDALGMKGTKNQVAYVRALLKHGADIHHHLPRDTFWTPLRDSVSRSHPLTEEMLLILLEHSPPRTWPEAQMLSYLHTACRSGNIAFLETIFKNGADISLLKTNATQLLHVVVDELPFYMGITASNIDRLVDTIDLLVKCGAQWTEQDEFDETALVKLTRVLGLKPAGRPIQSLGMASNLRQRIEIEDKDTGNPVVIILPIENKEL